MAVEADIKKTSKKRKSPANKDPNSSKRHKSDANSSTQQEATDEVDSEIDKKERKRMRKEVKRLAKLQTTVEQSMDASPAPSASDIQQYLSEHAVTIHESQLSGPVKPILDFHSLPIEESLKASLSGFERPTPIQACSWPTLLAGNDAIGIAETGSGKTLAFGIPALEHVLSLCKNQCKKAATNVVVLVVAPTRELAIQTHETFLQLGQPFGIGSVCVYGGVGRGEQIQSLRDAATQLLVGTPGRLLDLCNDGACDLSKVTYLVLDEADRMLDKGFENDVRQIIERTSEASKRQTVMFSATWPDSVRKLANSFLRDPVRIVVGSDELTANKKVTQVVEVFDDPWSKDSRLSGLLKKTMHKARGDATRHRDAERVLIFVLYKKEASRVEGTLRRQGYSVTGLHGDLSQEQRLTALNNFKTGQSQLLVATDVAARGLDIPDVSMVINYSFPLTVEDYIHRIGRTGRGGKDGQSITFFTGENHERALAGELARVLRDSGFDSEPLQKKFPMSIKKKEHGAYGAFFRDDIKLPAAPQKIKF